MRGTLWEAPQGAAFRTHRRQDTPGSPALRRIRTFFYSSRQIVIF